METIPERFSLTVKDARTWEGHVLLTEDVNERRGPQHCHTGDAGPYFRVIAERLASEQLDITADMKFDVRFEENGSCQVAAGWKDHFPATPGGTGIDGPLDRRGIHCRSVAARAIVRDVDHKGRDSDFTSAYILNPIRFARLRARDRKSDG